MTDTPRSIFQEDQWQKDARERLGEQQAETSRLLRESVGLHERIKVAERRAVSAEAAAEEAEAALLVARGERGHAVAAASSLKERNTRITEAARAVDELSTQLVEVGKLLVRLAV